MHQYKRINKTDRLNRDASKYPWKPLLFERMVRNQQKLDYKRRVLELNINIEN